MSPFYPNWVKFQWESCWFKIGYKDRLQQQQLLLKSASLLSPLLPGALVSCLSSVFHGIQVSSFSHRFPLVLDPNYVYQ